MEQKTGGLEGQKWKDRTEWKYGREESVRKEEWSRYVVD